MAGLLSGLEKLGLKKLETMDLYESSEEKAQEPDSLKATEQNTVTVKETDFLFDKTYECPVCYRGFKARTLRSSKARLIRTDKDLRPVYENIEPLKYDVVACPYCGYAALSRYFGGLTPTQIKAVKENISRNFQGSSEKKEVFTYEEALARYKLSLANTIVKRGRSSEKAYVCLKAGWLLRSMGENLKPSEEGYNEKLEDIRNQEKEFLKNALEGLITARQNESYPICGMDEITVEYLIAVLAMEFGQYEVASRLISGILTSPSATNRMKDRARDIKEELIVKIREKNAG